MEGQGLSGDGLQSNRGADGIDFLLGAGHFRRDLGRWGRRLVLAGADFSDLLLSDIVAGIDLHRMEELGEGALLIAGQQQLAAFADVEG